MGSSVKLDKPTEKDLQKYSPARKTPAGPSEVFKNGCGAVLNLAVSTCEICGKVHPENRHATRFIHRKMVLSCCGRLLDETYEELGQLFCVTFLKEFSKDPNSPKFALLREMLPSIFADFMRKIESQSDCDFTLQK